MLPFNPVPIQDPKPWFFDYQMSPWLSIRQIRAHLVHHAKYVDEVRKAYHGDSLEEAIRVAEKSGDLRLHRSANQAWNHHMLWHSMSPTGGGDPGKFFNDLKIPIESQIRKAAESVFSSGWVWVTLNRRKVRVEVTQDDKRCTGTPLLCIDMWEHAHYVDYLGDREKYISVMISNVINWEFAAMRLDGYVPAEML